MNNNHNFDENMQGRTYLAAIFVPMKKYALALLYAATIPALAEAQIGIEGGLNMSNMAIKSGGTKLSTGFKAGGILGVVADIKMDDHIFFQPGLFYQGAGCAITGTPGGDYSISTITIPLNFVYKTGERCGARWLFGFGPYICRNISGTYSMDGYGPVPASSGDLQFGSGESANLKSMDVGANASIGYKSKKHFYYRLRFQMGLANMDVLSNAENSIHTMAIGAIIGYSFGSCKTRNHGFRSNNGSHWHGIKSGRYSTHTRNYHQRWQF